MIVTAKTAAVEPVAPVAYEPGVHKQAGTVVVRGMPDAVYHADDAVGASMLEDFRDNRQEYLARHVEKTIEPKLATKAMQFGALVHLQLLEPDRFGEAVAEPPPETAPDGKKWLRRKGSDHELWWQQELDKREGKIVADVATLRRVHDAVAAVRQHPAAAACLAEGEPELSIFWTDARSGLRCKCRIDWMNARIPLDLKTCPDASPAAFARTVATRGYHRKLAHYRAGLEAYLGEPEPIALVAVESDWPHRVAYYEIDDLNRDGFALGDEQRRTSLQELMRCHKSGDWSEAWQQEVTTLRLAGWAFYEDEYQLGGE